MNNITEEGFAFTIAALEGGGRIERIPLLGGYYYRINQHDGLKQLTYLDMADLVDVYTRTDNKVVREKIMAFILGSSNETPQL